MIALISSSSLTVSSALLVTHLRSDFLSIAAFAQGRVRDIPTTVCLGILGHFFTKRNQIMES